MTPAGRPAAAIAATRRATATCSTSWTGCVGDPLVDDPSGIRGGRPTAAGVEHEYGPLELPEASF